MMEQARERFQKEIEENAKRSIKDDKKASR